MSIYIGVIAEDNSDVEVIEEIIAKKKSRHLFKLKKFVGHSCGKVRTKCHEWACILSIQKCSILILLHDLDENAVSDLRREIEEKLRPSPIATHIIVIPVREIEAWLLADHEAINKTFGLSLKKIPNPESIRRPKEHLRDLVYLRSQKRRVYLNTAHNGKIAAKATLKQLSRCSSFVPLNDFLTEAL
jgi:hypothetical protein